MPYTYERNGDKVTVKKADTGEVVGHTTPGNLKAYLAALHMHENGMNEGGKVEMPRKELISEHKHLVDVLEEGTPEERESEAEKQARELLEYAGKHGRKYAYGGTVDEEEENPFDALVNPQPGRIEATPSVPGLTPEDRAALYEKVKASRTNPRVLIGEAMAGLGDALNVQAGRQSPGFLNKAIEAQRANEAQQLQNFDVQRQQQNLDARRKLAAEAQDPTSNYSRARQKSSAILLKSAGYKDEDIAAIPGAEIDTILKHATNFAEAKERAAAAKEAARLRAQAAKEAQEAKQIDPSSIEFIAGEVAAGRLAPNKIVQAFPRSAAGSTARSQAMKRAAEIYKEQHPNENLDISRLDRDYKNFQNATKALVAVETFLPNLDKLQSAISSLPPGAPLKSLNALLQKGEIQVGNQAATNVDMLKGVLAHELGASLGGGTALSDERVRMALDALNVSSPKEVALKALDMLRQIEVNRHVNVAMQGGIYGEKYLRDVYGEETANKLLEHERESRKRVGEKAVSLGGGESSGLKVGDVKKGYRYKGGDPSKAENWEKI